MKGFTLIELLVVVLIIGILASVALPQYEIVVEKSRATEAMVNARAILNAMQRHEQEEPEDPVTNCQQIADIQLKGGTWGQDCNVSLATRDKHCGENDNVFSTKNFCYYLEGGNLKVERSDGSRDPLYTINYSRDTEATDTNMSYQAEANCSGDYTQVCKLFTDL